jgi:hypothetical protein
MALAENGAGELFSIDLPDAEAWIRRIYAEEKRKVGWLVPAELRSAWHLILGRSSETLPRIFSAFEFIDIFVHDSEHSYENMMGEFRLAWPKIRKGGLLISDNVLWNRAYIDFCHETGKKPTIIAGLGVVTK